MDGIMIIFICEKLVAIKFVSHKTIMLNISKL